MTLWNKYYRICSTYKVLALIAGVTTAGTLIILKEAMMLQLTH
jgi:hypothetical protein